MPFPLICLSGFVFQENNLYQSIYGKKKSSCSNAEEFCLGAMSSALPLKMPNSDTSGATGKSPHFRSNK